MTATGETILRIASLATGGNPRDDRDARDPRDAGAAALAQRAAPGAICNDSGILSFHGLTVDSTASTRGSTSRTATRSSAA
jgi:hypothetical protein